MLVITLFIYTLKKIQRFGFAVVSTSTLSISPQRLEDFLTITMNAREISASKSRFSLVFFALLDLYSSTLE